VLCLEEKGNNVKRSLIGKMHKCKAERVVLYAIMRETIGRKSSSSLFSGSNEVARFVWNVGNRNGRKGREGGATA
jgi:hypothetical protein